MDNVAFKKLYSVIICSDLSINNDDITYDWYK